VAAQSAPPNAACRQATLHGCARYADYELVDRMAGRLGAVPDLPTQVWEPAKAQAAADREALLAMARSLGEPEEISAWDWRYLAQKARQARYKPGRCRGQALLRAGQHDQRHV
jgi:Zn-dependent oligopeptidase